MLKRMPVWSRWLLQLFISIGLVGFVLAQVDPEQVRAVVMRPQLTAWATAGVVLGFLLFNASKIVSAMRLNIYQRHIGVHLSERENLRLCYAGMFLNLFLPGGIGGDGYKIAVLRRQQHAPVRTLVLITLADRVSGLLTLLLLLMPLCVLLPPALLAPVFAKLPAFFGVRELAVAGALVIAGAFLLLHAYVLRIGGKTTLLVFGYSLVVQLMQLGCIMSVLLYLQVAPANFLAYLAVFLVSSVAAVLPLSVGGLGAREITFFYGLRLLSLEPTQGIVASSGFFLITLLSSLIGALFIGHAFPPPSAVSGAKP